MNSNAGEDGQQSAGSQGGQAPLEFVMVDEPILPPSQQNRQAVRRHVMRSYHSRRRARNSVPAKQHKLLQKGEQDDLPRMSLTPRHDQIGASGLIARIEFGREGDESISHDQHRVLQWTTVTGAGLGQASSSTQNVGSHGSFDRWVFETTTPYALLQADGAPILCMKSRGWPFPEPLGTLSPKVSSWMPTRNIAPPNWNVPRGCMHKSARVLPYIHNSYEYFAFKGETIKWVNDRLRNIELGTSDATIGSILVLINIEIARGNLTESVKHIDGIERIVSLRGGISNFGHNRHFLVKLLIQDLIVSIMSDTQPRLNSGLPSLLPPFLLGNRTKGFPDSPLCSSGRLQLILQGSSFCDESIRILDFMQDLTNASDLDDQGLLSAHIPHLLSLNTSHLPPHNLLRIVHLTCLIYSGAFQTPPTPFSSPLNRPLTVELCQAFESPVNDGTWDVFPGIFVWVLLIAASAAAQESIEYSFSVTLLVRIALSAGYGWFGELSEGMRVFMRIKRRSQGL